MEDLTQKAIKAALSSDWDEALRLNKRILVDEADNVDCFLRLAHAYYSLGVVKKAQTSAKKALKLSPGNHMAIKLIEKCKSTKNIKVRKIAGKINLRAFLETPGKTKLVKLVHLGTPSVISSILPGESVNLLISASKVTVETNEGVHIGRLPDDIASKVWSSRPNKFEAVIKSAEPLNVIILLQEFPAS